MREITKFDEFIMALKQWALCVCAALVPRRVCNYIIADRIGEVAEKNNIECLIDVSMHDLVDTL